VRRIAIVASASGNGKTTLGRALAERLNLPFTEMDALVHGPNWQELPDVELRARMLEITAAEGWVIDGSYTRKIGDLVLERADTVVWLDLPLRVWFPRLLRRTWVRWWNRQELWNGNRETLVGAVWGRDSLIGFALHNHFRRRRVYPMCLAKYRVVRLRTTDQVARFLDEFD